MSVVSDLLKPVAVRLVICSREVIPFDPDRHKGHGLHKACLQNHPACSEWFAILRTVGSTRDEQLVLEVLALHAGTTMPGVIHSTGFAAVDVDSAEGAAQLRAAGVDSRQFLTVQTPGGRFNRHVYGATGSSHLKPLFGCDIRDRRGYVIPPAWSNGLGGKYKIIYGRWGQYQTFPDDLLVSSMSPSADQLRLESSAYCSGPFKSGLTLGTTWYSQDLLEDRLEGRLEAPIGCWERELDWRFEDSFDQRISQRQREVRAVILQAAQRHRRLAVDVRQTAIAAVLGYSQPTVSRELWVLLHVGAIQMHTDRERGVRGYVSPAVAARTSRRALSRSYVVPGLAYQISDRPRGSRAPSHYQRSEK